MRRVLAVGVLFLFVLGLGLWLGHRSATPDPERVYVNRQFARTMLPFKVAFRVLLGGVALFTLAGLGWGGVRWLYHRVDTIYPDSAGLYPIRENRIGGAKVYHDPNRALTGTTVYAAGDRLVRVEQPILAGHLDVQQQVTAQAQVAQVLRAAVSGPSALPAGNALPMDLASQTRVSRPLPQVTELGCEPSHIDRLLLQDAEPGE